MIEDQINRWQMLRIQQPEDKLTVPTVTISRDPGSGGRIVAEKLAEHMNFHLFNQEVLHEMATSAHVSEFMLESLDEKGLSVLEDWISSLVYDRYLWPDQYLQHLAKVVGSIAKQGGAVILGRGAAFILPPEKQFRVRVTAPQNLRIEHVARQFNISMDEAKRRVIRTESDRKAFVRKYFNADVTDPVNYDLIINTAIMSIEHAVDVISAALGCPVECQI